MISGNLSNISIPYLPNILSALIYIGLVWILYYLLARGLGLVREKGKLADPIVLFSRRVLRWCAVVLAVVLLLQAFGLLHNVWAMISAVLAMVAIGFVAVWSVLSNALCSLILMIARPFRVGDEIELPPDGMKGKVVNFNMLFTTLKADGGAFLQIPNNAFFQRVIYRRPSAKQINLDEQLLIEQDAKV